MNKSEEIKQLLNEFANIMNATLIFNSVVGNHAIYTALKGEKGLSKDNIESKGLEFANNLADKIKEYIQLDTRTYYK